MKKYIILLSIFMLCMTGLFISVKIMERNRSNDTFGDEGIVSGFASLSGSGTVYEMEKAGVATDNPEGDYVNQIQIVMQGHLTSSDWDKRNESGLRNEVIASTIQQCVGLYAFDRIDAEEKQLYAEILLVMQGYGTKVPLCSTDAQKIEHITTCVFIDHPELFYVNGYLYEEHKFAGMVEKIVFSPNYTMTQEEAEYARGQIDEYTDACFMGLPSNADEYTKVKYVYEFIILNTDYNLDAPDNQNICSVFLGRQSVCLGYAKAVQYLLQQLDVSATIVTGTVMSGEGHAWNLVQINGQYYYVDATWGDSSYSAESEDIEALSSVNYDYLCITTNDLGKTHKTDNPISLPVCVAVMDNYYIKEGLYLNCMDSLRLETIFNNAYANGKNCVSIRCSDEKVYQEMQKTLLDDGQVFYFLKDGTNTIAYTSNPKLYTYTFML